MKYQIEARSGVVFGIYDGATPRDAFVAMLAEAGAEYGEPQVGTEADWIITEVDDCMKTDRRVSQFHPIPTLREADKIARKIGLVRGNGTYNGAPYWKNANGQIVTRDRLAELAGMV